ncbi:DMT family transporter [Streptomyces sp. GC420]|uniref:DMT family transporter n=1 Tax=Streptomyces sp. GC420 TaxID=2697568 RepID=UPI001AA1C769|nr:DMT family transporter [Streptomyces sp. GC420]
MSALALSVLLSLISAVAYAAGAIVQERVATTTPDGSCAPFRRGGWWTAVALNGTGAVLHVVALAYGPLSLVQPLGALTIVFALPMAALFVRRRAGATAWRGAIMATAGLAGLLSLIGGAGTATPGDAERTVLALVTFGACAVLLLAARRAHRPVTRSVILAGAAGIAFGVASVFTKMVAEDWDPAAPLAEVPSLLVVAATGLGGLLISQAAYRGAGLAAPLAVVTVVNPVGAAVVGTALFGETFRFGLTGTVLALGSGIVAAGGLVLLTVERTARGEEARAAASPAEVPVPARVPVPATVPAVETITREHGPDGAALAVGPGYPVFTAAAAGPIPRPTARVPVPAPPAEQEPCPAGRAG